MKETVVLIMCGSFNPVTNMHLRIMENARDHLHHCGYVVKRGIISPVHDNYPKDSLISITHRNTMLKLALESSDWLQLSTWESEQNGWTETFNVLRHHQGIIHELTKSNNINKSVRNKTDVNANMNCDAVSVKLVCGGDFLASFLVPDLWKPEHIELILKNYGLVVISRTGYDIANIIEESDILYKYMTRIIIVNEFIENTISSTKIRKACSRGRSIKYLVPDKVERYIKSHSLYSESKIKCESTKNGPYEKANLVNDILNNSMKLKKITVTASKKMLQNNVRRKKKQPEEVIRISRRLRRKFQQTPK